MVAIIIGNKRNNVVQILKESWTARLLFAGCLWYVYDMFGKRAVLHADSIFLIFSMSVLLLNLLFIPFRLLGDKGIGRDIKLVFIIVADVVALYFFNTAREISFASIWKNIVVGVIISLLVTGIILALCKMLAVHSQKAGYGGKSFNNMTGWEFEAWCGVWLQKHGFSNVRVTSGSGDYGADVLCTKNGKTYAVQCKLYSGKVPYKAVEEVVCAREYYGCDAAMIFTNSELTAQASEAARKLGVVVYDGAVIK